VQWGGFAIQPRLTAHLTAILVHEAAMPLPRFRIRTLMIAVAVVAAALFVVDVFLRLERRSAVFAAKAGFHARMTRLHPTRAHWSDAAGYQYEAVIGLEAYHSHLFEKYAVAATHPWLPVPPDPPEPK
jgi:hypothetical protein